MKISFRHIGAVLFGIEEKLSNEGKARYTLIVREKICNSNYNNNLIIKFCKIGCRKKAIAN